MNTSQTRDAEEIRLNYCKKCGDTLDEHNDDFCSSHKYPNLEAEGYTKEIKIAEEYNFDLTKANQKNADSGRHGSVEGDIVFDACTLINDYKENNDGKIRGTHIGLKALTSFVCDGLANWGWEEKEIGWFRK